MPEVSRQACMHVSSPHPNVPRVRVLEVELSQRELSLLYSSPTQPNHSLPALLAFACLLVAWFCTCCLLLLLLLQVKLKKLERPVTHLALLTQKYSTVAYTYIHIRASLSPLPP